MTILVTGLIFYIMCFITNFVVMVTFSLCVKEFMDRDILDQDIETILI